MIYELAFLPSALKEWEKIGETIRRQFKKKLQERLTQPHVPAARLSGMASHYKIKLRQSGYRLVYRVEEESVTVVVVALGKRERGDVYTAAKARID